MINDLKLMVNYWSLWLTPVTCPFDPLPAHHQWKQASLLCLLPLSPFHKKNLRIQAQKRKVMDFTFTRAMMKLKKANSIKFKSNWSNELKEICTKFKSNSD